MDLVDKYLNENISEAKKSVTLNEGTEVTVFAYPTGDKYTGKVEIFKNGFQLRAKGYPTTDNLVSVAWRK